MLNCPRCQIVWYQIVCGVSFSFKLSTVSNYLVSNCLQCQIVHNFKLWLWHPPHTVFKNAHNEWKWKCSGQPLHQLHQLIAIFQWGNIGQICYWIYFDTDIESEWQLKDYSYSLYLWLVKCLWFSFGPVNCLKLGNSTPILHCLFCFRRCPLGCP